MALAISIDPGSRKTGYAIWQDLRPVVAEVISGGHRAMCQEIASVMGRWKPSRAWIEAQWPGRDRELIVLCRSAGWWEQELLRQAGPVEVTWCEPVVWHAWHGNHGREMAWLRGLGVPEEVWAEENIWAALCIGGWGLGLRR